MLEQAYQAALDGERRHRRGRPGRHKASAQVAAKYFAVKWVAHAPLALESWLDAVDVRTDVLYGQGLRAWLSKHWPGPFQAWLNAHGPSIEAVNYVQDLV